MRAVALGDATGEENRDEHFDTKEEPKDARHDAENHRKTANYLEPRNKDASRTRESHAHKHAFNAANIPDLRPAMHEEDETDRDTN